MSRWVITDIHGCYHTFKALLEEQIKLTSRDTLYLLGDYISKGPYSKQVLDYLMQLQERGFDMHLLRGNHEQEMLNALQGTTSLTTLREKGGFTFLKNFEADHPAAIPDHYINFMEQLDWYFTLDQWLLVHAGFDFDAADPFAPSEAMVNIRDYSVDLQQTAGRRIIHGHSPTDLNQITNTLRTNKAKHLSLDAGCVYRDNNNQGVLLALNLDSWHWKTQKNIDESNNYEL